MPAYLSLTSGQKFLVGKHGAEDGVTATVQYYSKVFPHDSQNSPIFPLPSGITVLVIRQLLPPKFHYAGICQYFTLSIFCHIQ